MLDNLFRSTKRPVRYIEAELLSEEGGSDVEEVCKDSSNVTSTVTVPSPVKKPKVSMKEKTTTLVEDKESSDVKEDEPRESSKPKTTKKEAKKKKKKSKKKKEKKGGKTSSVIDVDLIDDGAAKPPLPCLPPDDVAKELHVPTGLCISEVDRVFDLS